MARPERLLISRTYSTISNMDETGNYDEEHGYLFEDRPGDAYDAISELNGCVHCSVSPATRCTISPHAWATTEADTDPYTGETTEESVFIKRHDGKPLTGSSLFRLFRLAGLTD